MVQIRLSAADCIPAIPIQPALVLRRPFRSRPANPAIPDPSLAVSTVLATAQEVRPVDWEPDWQAAERLRRLDRHGESVPRDPH
jgi:hypothetical protein